MTLNLDGQRFSSSDSGEMDLPEEDENDKMFPFGRGGGASGSAKDTLTAISPHTINNYTHAQQN